MPRPRRRYGPARASRTSSTCGRSITAPIIGGQIGLFGLDHIFAFIGLLSGKVDRMFEEAEDAVLI
jgi:hypothetical protein